MDGVGNSFRLENIGRKASVLGGSSLRECPLEGCDGRKQQTVE